MLFDVAKAYILLHCENEQIYSHIDNIVALSDTDIKYVCTNCITCLLQQSLSGENAKRCQAEHKAVLNLIQSTQVIHSWHICLH